MKRLKNITEYYKPSLFVIGLLCTLPVMLGSSCSNETEIDDGPVSFEVLRAVMQKPNNVIKCRFNSENIERDTTNGETLSDLELVIDTQADFDKFITCDDSVSVNFGQEFVLAGMTKTHPTEVYIFNQSVEMKRSKLYYHVGVIETFAARPSGAEYIVKIQSRDYLKYPVIFDVYWETYE